MRKKWQKRITEELRECKESLKNYRLEGVMDGVYKLIMTVKVKIKTKKQMLWWSEEFKQEEKR